MAKFRASFYLRHGTLNANCCVLDDLFLNVNGFHKNGKLKLRNAQGSKPHILRSCSWDELQVVPQKDGGKYELHLSDREESSRTTNVHASAKTLQCAAG